LPVVPAQSQELLDGAKRYWDFHERNVFDDIVRQEVEDGRRLIYDNGDFVLVAPYASRFPFEVWIVPRAHGTRFETTSRRTLDKLAEVLTLALDRLDRGLGDPPYNFIIQSAPYGLDDVPWYRWHVVIMPTLTPGGRVRVGDGFLHQPHGAGRGRGVLAQRARLSRLEVPMRVLHITGEVAPFSKTGGLGDVLGALPAAQRALGLHVEVLTPLYGFVRRQGLIAGETYDFHLASHTLQARLWRTPDAHVTFVDIPGLLDRSVPYGEFADNPLRFGAFCKVASIVARRDFDVVNLHDWQAAATAIYLGRSRPVVQTIHNLAYQGLCGFHWADALEIPHALRGYDGLEFHGHMSLFKAGLVLADRITTVSPRYARERSSPSRRATALGAAVPSRARPAGHLERHRRGRLGSHARSPSAPSLRRGAPRRARGQPGRAARRGGPAPDGRAGLRCRLAATWQKGLDLVADVLPSSHLWHSRFVMLADGDHDLIARFDRA
jgi:starch synthase